MIVWNESTMHLTGEVVPGDWMGNKGSRSFLEELSHQGDVVLEINSPGGDVMAGASIYNALLKHRAAGHKVTAHVTGMAASIASVIAMAASKVLMGPVSFMMIHEPWTITAGNAAELTHEAAVLREIGDGLAVAYARKTGKSMAQIKHAMATETWMNAPDAIAEGFADGYITDGSEEPSEQKTVAARAARMSGTARIAAMLRDGKEDGVMAVFGELISDARKKKAEEPEEEPEQEPEQEPEEPEQDADPEEEPEEEPEREPEDPEQNEEPEEEPEEENPEEPEQGAGEPEDPEQEPEQEEEPEEEDPEKEDPEQARKSAQRRAEIRDWALSLINGR